MVNTVALLAPTGLLGANLLTSLVEKHNEGKIKLVVLHRATSDVSKVPEGIEKRVFDINTATAEDVQAVLKNIDILVSATNKTSPEADARFVESLAAVKTLKAYIPSDYALNYTDEEESDPANAIAYNKAVLVKKARELGVPITVVHNGLFEPFIGIIGVDIKGNNLNIYPEALERSVPVTSVPYLASAVAQLVTKDPAELANRSFTVVEYEATGKQFSEALAAVKGSAPALKPYTAEDEAAARQNGPFGVLTATVHHKWGFGSFDADDGFVPEGIPRRTVEQSIAVLAQA